MQAATDINAGWTEVGKLEDIPRLGSRIIRRAAGDIALFRTSDDQVFALLNRCPHKGGPLSEGIVSGRAVTCPLHNMCFDLETGEAKGPDEGHVTRFPTRIEEGAVQVNLSGEPEAAGGA